jgi:hypothetical protein
MEIYPRSYKYEAEQKCSEYDRDNLADVEVVFNNNCVYKQVSGQAKRTKQTRI